MSTSVFGSTSPGVIQTFTGLAYNVLKPDPALINVADVAHALAMKCRFNGHTKFFYSVAEHSVHVWNLADKDLAALLHDAAEAYLPDVARPLKYLQEMEWFRSLEKEHQASIFALFGAKPTNYAKVKWADNIMLGIEALELLGPHLIKEFGEAPIVAAPYRFELPCWDPEEAELRFLEAFAQQ